MLKTLETEFRRRLKYMTVPEICRVVWVYAYANRADPSFFRDIEMELDDRELE